LFIAPAADNASYSTKIPIGQHKLSKEDDGISTNMYIETYDRRWQSMDQFNELVSTQLKTMDKLLYLQSELERCQQIEQQLITLRQNTELEEIREEIDRMKAELKDIHRIFEEQTEEVIRSYQDMNIVIR
jgi:uncharacterized phage infection (PIP) family protein YhgE